MINLNDLTLRQIKEIQGLLGSQVSSKPHPLIGQHVIARCYSAGVHAGYVESVDGENVILKNSRRLWKWQAKDGLALSGVAQNGLNRDESKLDVLNPVIYLTGVCELIPTTDKARESIDG